MRFSLAFLAAALLTACSPTPESRTAQAAARAEGGFPLPDRPVAGIVAPEWSSGPDRDAADESGQLIRGLEIAPGMRVADIGAGSGYHTLRLSPAVGPTGIVYAEDIVEAYISGLRREAERRKLTNIRIVVGTPDDPKLPAKSIDRAVLVHMYHEVENPYALLWNLAGALKPGARVGVIDLDRATASHGMPPALLKCEFEAVGYRQLSSAPMAGGVGYLAIFEAPVTRPKPADIRACKAP
ncbi:MAG: class I SAM-dependent methyltransferase [Phenylobacterium sp.]|jgi:SAM-dependent methyltransferase|uniref:methyltransferase domain-containing protein n=1 Tax=unclassified Phenylobacterium TaxID=2640670 RepID=UPI0008B8C53E|nr:MULTISPECIES: methyltransferase domain-containing protein [unclassified Phenylobacterium]MBJ7411063.1 class I SAM-dependent methyltransferase [Phenylobacterium sp.]OHB29205.1 MAG: methyltransferase type 11 [Phenylobacterium sp. RIFCSPHIGHO2_01_FULL_69_31]